jgi:hypothetical protein
MVRSTPKPLEKKLFLTYVISAKRLRKVPDGVQIAAYFDLALLLNRHLNTSLFMRPIANL